MAEQIAEIVWLSLVAYLGVDKVSGKRRILEILEVESATDGAIQIAPIFRYRARQSAPEWTREAGMSRFVDILKDSALRLPENGSVIRFEHG